MSAATENHYDRVARFYDGLATLYSLGRIRACKHAQLGELKAGQRVLFAGAGSGEEAVLAARVGARVSVAELAPRMLARARRRFQAAGLAGEIEVLAGDVLQLRREGGYDVVLAQFFLNVFGPELMPEVLGHLARQLRPGGRLLIADFAPATGSPGGRWFRRLYFGCAVRAFHLLAGNALHALYDYTPILAAAGLRLEAARGFRPPAAGPVLFQTWSAVR